MVIHRRRAIRRKTLFSVFLFLAIIAVLFWTLAPVYWLIVSSITTTAELASVPPHWVPYSPTFERYLSIIKGGTIHFRGTEIQSPASLFKYSIWNSVVIATVTMVICLFLGTLAAYAIARLRFPFRNTLLSAAIMVQALPPIVLLIPFYWILRDLGLIDTKLALIITNTSLLLVYVIWVMSNYFRSVPIELEEAARIDGCSRIQALFRVVLPVSAPGLVASGLLVFLFAWDEFLFALTYTSSVNAKPITVAIGEFSTQHSIDYGMMMTGGVLAAIPPVILALLFQRFIVSGLTAGSVKE